LQIGMQIRSAHSRMSLADIMSRPVAFDTLSLLRSEKNWRLKWFKVSLKRCIVDGRREKS